MTQAELLNNITVLSHLHGGCEYVKGGGGNTSVKDENTLWVKPSGTTLLGLQPHTFVAMDRKRLSEIYTLKAPTVAAEREKLVLTVMENAKCEDIPARASVEAPLHNIFDARYVVHTHPPMVNGMTCGINGKESCEELFPDALWVDYIDPGYTLCIEVMREIDAYVEKNNSQPKLLFMKNHGVFVAADSVEEMTSLYKDMMAKLNEQYQQKNINLVMASEPAKANMGEKLQQVLDSYSEINGSIPSVATGNFLTLPSQPLTPDHIVYMKAKLFSNEPTVENLKAFKEKNGYLPLLLTSDDGFISVGETQASAQLTMTLAMDEAYVLQLSEAFGGIEVMTQEAQDFIINWESEAYRKKQS